MHFLSDKKNLDSELLMEKATFWEIFGLKFFFEMEIRQLVKLSSEITRYWRLREKILKKFGERISGLLNNPCCLFFPELWAFVLWASYKKGSILELAFLCRDSFCFKIIPHKVFVDWQLFYWACVYELQLEVAGFCWFNEVAEVE